VTAGSTRSSKITAKALDWGREKARVHLVIETSSRGHWTATSTRLHAEQINLLKEGYDRMVMWGRS
jgi:hypothetical protein